MKKINILLILICSIIIIVGSIILINNKEHYITDNEYLYDIALNYLINKDDEESNSDHDRENYHFFATYDGLGITEKNNIQYIYMWVLGESYYLDKGEIKGLSGYSMFYKFTFENNKIINVEIPEDGSNYKKSIKKMCPDSKMINKVLNYNSKLSLTEQVNQYYNR